MLTIAETLKAHSVLQAISDSARLDVEVLLAAALKKDRTYLYTWPEKIITEDEKTIFDGYLQRRANGEPIAYIVGEKEFWSLNLMVNNSTLIPRPDTEVLVETALSLFAEDDPLCKRKLVDLGTGTGAIALALASEKPQWQVVAVDNDRAACELAEKNRQKHRLSNVTIICSNWLQAVEMPLVDLIVSNPPYVEKNDPHLSQGDVRFEPHSALTANNNGLEDIETIITQSAKQLLPGGWLLLEHGYRQAEAVIALLLAHGYGQCFTANDMSGHPRVTVGQLTHE